MKLFKRLFGRICLYSIIYLLNENLLHIKLSDETWVTLCLGFEAFMIGLIQINNTRDSLEIELFLKFNERYGSLNQDLKKFEGKKLFNMEDKDMKILEDYINLCCEEYYCFRVKKQIPFRIWKFWHNGIMFHWEKCDCLKEFWAKEYSETDSFYIRCGDHPFRIEGGKRNLQLFFEGLLQV